MAWSIDSGSYGELAEAPAHQVIDERSELDQLIAPTHVDRELLLRQLDQDRLLVAVSAGVRPTSGYTAGVSMEHDEHTVTLTCLVSEPPADAAVLQVLTYPWTLVAVTLNGRELVIEGCDSGEYSATGASLR